MDIKTALKHKQQIREFIFRQFDLDPKRHDYGEPILDYTDHPWMVKSDSEEYVVEYVDDDESIEAWDYYGFELISYHENDLYAFMLAHGEDHHTGERWLIFDKSRQIKGEE